MKIRAQSCLAMILVGSFLASEPMSRAATNSQPPNVIIILSDDQGYGDLSINGHPFLKTPNLDRLMHEGVRLQQFHVAPTCTPSRGALLTGQDAMRNGSFCYQYGREMIRLDTPTIAEIFRTNGYRTGLFGKWHLGDASPYRPEDRGFDEVITFGGACMAQTPDYWNNDYYDDVYRHNGKWKKFPGYCDDVWFDNAMKFASESQKRGRPFFIYLASNLPHGPLFVEDKYRAPYLSRMELKEASFFGCLARFDQNVGRLDDFLRANGLQENTIVIFAGDNGSWGGANFYNAGMRGAKWSYYDGGHRVPCAFRWPQGKVSGNREISSLTEAQDIAPTLVELCGLTNALNAHFDGISLAGALRSDDPLPDRTLVVQCSTNIHPIKWESAVLWQSWRLVNGNELFNLANDPGQKTNVAAAESEIFNRLREKYLAWWDEVEPGTRQPLRWRGGGDGEGPVSLSCFDWFGQTGEGNVTMQKSVRQGLGITGFWNIEIERAGRYEVKLRRWPAEVKRGIGESVPEYKAWDWAYDQSASQLYPKGRALPIVRAKLEFGNEIKVRDVKPEDRAVSFVVNLAAGPTRLQGWFLDGQTNTVCGAYYAELRLMNSARPGANERVKF